MDETEQRPQSRYEREHDPFRVLTLADGVFAIILTLLVLEIHVPDLAEGQSLTEAMQEIRPSFVGFLISFIVVAIAWVGHRDLFMHVRRMDLTLIWLNFVYLLPVSLVPFGASLLARYDENQVGLETYGGILIAIAAARIVTWLYATRQPQLLYEEIDQRMRQDALSVVILQAVLYGVAVTIAGSRPHASLVLYVLVPTLYFAGLIRTKLRPRR